MTIMINKRLLQSTTCIYYSTIRLTLWTQAHYKQGEYKILKRMSSSPFRRNLGLRHMYVESAGHASTDATWMSGSALQEVQAELGMKSSGVLAHGMHHMG